VTVDVLGWGARAQIPIAGPIQIQIPSLVAEDIAGRFVALTPFGVSANIPASDACSEIDPEPGSTREAGTWIVPDAVAAARCPDRSELRQDRGTTMSNDPRRRSRRRSRIQVELLESRALLSASSVSSADRFLLITPSSEFVTQQDSAFTVTLTLAEAQKLPKVEAAGGYTAAALDEPVTVDFSALLQSAEGGPATAVSPIFAPFNESVTFPAGVTTETVTVPIISTAATPGPMEIWLSATTTSSTVQTVVPMDLAGQLPAGPPDWVELYSSPNAAPPTITSVQLVTHGKLASAVVLGFSKPMAPATVENIHNYRLLSRPITIDHSGSFTFSLSDGPGSFMSETTEYQSFPIAAATYDPSTRAVTLTLKRPAKASSLYEISGAYPARGHELTDLEGQQLTTLPEGPSLVSERVAAFTFAVRPALVINPSPVGALKSTTGGTNNWFSG
jgi:hypothetical protein